MAAAKDGSSGKASDFKESGRVTIQLDKASGDTLDRVVAHVGKQAGESLGLTVTLSRADVVRSLIAKAAAGIDTPAEEEPTPLAAA